MAYHFFPLTAKAPCDECKQPDGVQSARAAWAARKRDAFYPALAEYVVTVLSALPAR